MTILHLGVLDIPYVNLPSPKARKVHAGTVTTGDVAGWLERRYHVMEIFYRENAQYVADRLANSMQGAIESLLMGAPAAIDKYGGATSDIQSRFQKFIDQKEMDRLGYPGVPTRASLLGVSKRFKRNRGPVRPSFQDSGLYEISMRSWVD